MRRAKMWCPACARRCTFWNSNGSCPRCTTSCAKSPPAWKHYKDMQDFEFTIQDGKLYMLQTRNGKRTGLAAVRVALQMVDEGLITKEEAIFRVEPNQLYDFLVPRLDE